MDIAYIIVLTIVLRKPHHFQERQEGVNIFNTHNGSNEIALSKPQPLSERREEGEHATIVALSKPYSCRRERRANLTHSILLTTGLRQLHHCGRKRRGGEKEDREIKGTLISSILGALCSEQGARNHKMSSPM